MVWREILVGNALNGYVVWCVRWKGGEGGCRRAAVKVDRWWKPPWFLVLVWGKGG